MKKLILSLLIVFAFIGVNAQDNTLLTVGDTKISKEEFLAIYKKNNFKDSVMTQASLDEYLELYINFRLKVLAAEEAGLNETDKFKDEFDKYQKQLAQKYLIDKKVTDNLIQEGYERLKQEVRASHILIKISENSLPEDTLIAYNKIMGIKKRIEKGEASFEQLARELSDDPSAEKNGGDLNYFSALRMVYPFETAAYNTPVGQISNPVRTRFGYHIIKVTDKRPARGEIKVAHIMLRLPKDKENEQEMLKVEKKIFEIKQKLDEGGKFSSLAKTFSEDPASARKGGALPSFRTGTYPNEFEDVAYSLENDNDYSEPFKTDFGWHIIQRLEYKPMGTFEEMKSFIENKISRDSRAEISKKVVLNRIKKEYKFKEYPKSLKAVVDIVDSTLYEGTWDSRKGADLKKKMFVLDGVKHTQKDFIKHLESFNGKRRKAPVNEVVVGIYNDWVRDICMATEESYLPKKYPEYKSLLEEYRNGILLFDMMDQMVWTKSINDTTGLEAFHEAHKTDFMWQDRLQVNIYSCSNDSVADAVRSMIESGKTEKEALTALNKDSELNLSVERGSFEKEDKDVLSKIKWEKGWSDKVKMNGATYVVLVKDVIPAGPKKLSECRGLAIAAYQNHLDEAWIKELRAKYSFQVNDDVYKTILP